MSLTFADLKREIDEVQNRHPKLKDDQALVAWFLEAYAGSDEASALHALPGPSGEKGIDAVWIDDVLDQVFVVQGKYHKAISKSSDERGPVNFAGIAPILIGPLADFNAFVNGIDPAVKAKLKLARDKLLRGYRLQMCWASTGRISSLVEREAARIVKGVKSKHRQPAAFVLHDGARILSLLREWLDGASPPVASVDLLMPEEPIKWFDKPSGITLWVFWMSGYDIADLYRESTVRIFHRNIRGYLGLGDSAINSAMLDSIQKEPKYFIYLNNGVTIVCDTASREGDGGIDYLHVTGPQIINGQQTTRVLAEAGKDAKKAHVLVRVIQIPPAMRLEAASYEGMVSRIVEATNRQNAIKSTDLRANAREQVLLERALNKLGYQYHRKRQSSSEARSLIDQSKWQVKKEDFAKAVGACLEPGLPRRVGMEKLFSDEYPYYDKIFRSSKPYPYLCRWWLLKKVEGAARGSSDRQWAKFNVVYFLWHELGGDITKHPARFVSVCEQGRRFPHLATALERIIDAAYKEALRDFRLNRGKGKDRIEISVFFKRRDVYEGFEAFWKSTANKSSTTFARNAHLFESELKRP